MPAVSWVHKMIFSGRAVLAGKAVAGGEPQRCELGLIRQEMVLAVQACSPAHRSWALAKVGRAVSPMELWMLRPEIYLYLAQDLGQCEANARINALLPLFRDWIQVADGMHSKHNGGDGPGLH
ncbi:MAG: hypothetical protein ABIU58_01465 [Ramlibacter sp.]